MRNTQNLDTMNAAEVESMEVCEWHPERDGRGSPTQVHLLLSLMDSPVQLVLRLKSARACDELVDALAHHRQNVWGQR